MASESDTTRWRPSASMDMLKKRSEGFRKVREFFHQRQVVEVDTPLLMPHTVTEPFMTALSLPLSGKTAFLQTSPEYAMKRLLAAGMGDCYQLSKCFRGDEVGRKHQPEFTLLEWYRVGWDHLQLMEEVYQFVATFTGITERVNMTYQDAFKRMLAFDPLTIDTGSLQQIAEQQLGQLPEGIERDDYLSLLFEAKIEPQIAQDRIAFVYDFPASQSSLARLIPDNPTVSGRFEVYCQGIELANGFWELLDAEEQRSRFEHDQRVRKKLQKPDVEIDELFLSALEHGLPDCAGVALGFDRLMMIAEGAEHINDVIPFPWRAR